MRIHAPAAAFLTAGVLLFAPSYLGWYMSGHQHFGSGTTEPQQHHHHHHASQAATSQHTATADHSAHSMAQDGQMAMDMSMPMFFQATLHTVLWLRSWETHTPGAYVLAVLGIFVFGIAHESLGLVRKQLAQHASTRKLEPLLSQSHGALRSRLVLRATDSALYALHLATGYLLMLAVMTFNVGFFFAVVLGMGVGHFLFHAPSKTPAGDVCHEASAMSDAW